ncbi:MAG: carboxy-S-adenosyl-L-methionine synthase CmoA [Oligoflexus sp.]
MEKNQEQPELRLISEHDRLFESQRYPRPFSFNEEVAGVFDDMVRRSIPLYFDVHHYLGNWCRRFHQSGTTVIDIGCSTGTTIDYLSQCLSQRASFLGIDSSAAMILKARQKLQNLPAQHEVQLICQDIQQLSLPPASIVIMNYTLQFLPVSQRPALLKRIFDCLLPGGLFFISEKVRASHPLIQETTTHIYEKFKLDQGYSQTEIARKKEALENVLIPYTEIEHRQILADAGFQAVETVMKWNNFSSFVAIKE